MYLRALRLVAAGLVAASVTVASPGGSWGPAPAEAAVSVAASLDELILGSRAVVVAVARERKSLWEEVGGSRRIVTYTRLEVQDAAFGPKTIVGRDAPPVWIRTLGGAVGEIGQQVSGEAQLSLDKRALLFVAEASDGTLVVNGMAQGHFPIDEADAEKRTPAKLRVSPVIGKVLRRPGPTISVQEELSGRELQDALTHLRAAKARLDAAKAPQ